MKTRVSLKYFVEPIVEHQDAWKDSEYVSENIETNNSINPFQSNVNDVFKGYRNVTSG